MSDETKDLPMVVDDDDDGFHPIAPTDRTIIGTQIKCTDGVWSQMGITIPPGSLKLLALATTTVIQRWKDQQVVERFSKKPLPGLRRIERSSSCNPVGTRSKRSAAQALRNELGCVFARSSDGRAIHLHQQDVWSQAGRRDAAEPRRLDAPAARRQHCSGGRACQQTVQDEAWRETAAGIQDHQMESAGQQWGRSTNRSQTLQVQPGLTDAKPVSLGEEMNDAIGF